MSSHSQFNLSLKENYLKVCNLDKKTSISQTCAMVKLMAFASYKFLNQNSQMKDNKRGVSSFKK